MGVTMLGDEFFGMVYNDAFLAWYTRRVWRFRGTQGQYIQWVGLPGDTGSGEVLTLQDDIFRETQYVHFLSFLYIEGNLQFFPALEYYAFREFIPAIVVHTQLNHWTTHQANTL